MIFCDNPNCDNHVHVSARETTLEKITHLNGSDPWGLIDTTVVGRHEFRVNYSFANKYPEPPSTYSESTWLCDTCAAPVKFLQDRTNDFKRRMILSGNPR